MAKSKNLFLSLLMAAFISGLAFGFSGCSALPSIPKVEYCFNCDGFPLVYQGKIQHITGNRYIRTACLEIDLNALFANKAGGEKLKEDFLENLSENDFIQISYDIRQGEFCARDDKSTYVVSTVAGEGDNLKSKPKMEVDGVPSSSITKLEQDLPYQVKELSSFFEA